MYVTGGYRANCTLLHCGTFRHIDHFSCKPVAVDPNPQKGIGCTSQASPTKAGIQVTGQAVSKNETDGDHAFAILYGHAAVAIE